MAARDSGGGSVQDPIAPRDRLVPFGSREAVSAWLRARAARVSARHGGAESADLAANTAVPAPMAAPTPAAAPAPTAGAVARTTTSAPNPGPGTPVGGNDSITNNQVQGVDEGDIVKMHGDHLVVLRRGRLFSVRVGGSVLSPASMVDAYGPGRAPAGWYDELLIDGDTIVVIGYSYRARASEVGLFDIDAEGVIRWRDTLFVRSSDYYSARNYASRLVGHHLVMYMPIPLHLAGEELSLPAVRSDPDGAWRPVVDFDRLYRPVQPTGWQPMIHTVLSCDLARRGFDCRALGVVGPAGRNFYVSGSAVYLWVHSDVSFPLSRPAPDARQAPPPAVLYRIPLDRGAVGAVRVRGAPVDQFSFDERGEDLRVVLRAEGSGEAMWASENASGDVGLVRVPLTRFGAEVPTVGRTAYRGLPRLQGDRYAMQNRFVGDRLLYGTGAGWRGRLPGTNASEHPVWVYDLHTDTAHEVRVSHSVERLEPLGRDALVVGNVGSDLVFSAVALDATPTVVGEHRVRNASQGETRSHGFFFSPAGDRQGTLGLPVTYGPDGGGFAQLHRVSSSVLFLGVEGLRLRELGALRSGSAGGVNDRCVASCTDWYGNARPIFWRGRTFALLGYELVEGEVTREGVRELGRVDFLRALYGQAQDRSGNVFNNIPEL